MLGSEIFFPRSEESFLQSKVENQRLEKHSLACMNQKKGSIAIILSDEMWGVKQGRS